MRPSKKNWGYSENPDALPLNIDLTSDSFFSSKRDRNPVDTHGRFIIHDMHTPRLMGGRRRHVPWEPLLIEKVNLTRRSIFTLGSVKDIREADEYMHLIEQGKACYRCGAEMDKLPWHMVYMLCRECEDEADRNPDPYLQSLEK